jgi:hypothetical protein
MLAITSEYESVEKLKKALVEVDEVFASVEFDGGEDMAEVVSLYKDIQQQPRGPLQAVAKGEHRFADGNDLALERQHKRAISFFTCWRRRAVRITAVLTSSSIKWFEPVCDSR